MNIKFNSDTDQRQIIVDALDILAEQAVLFREDCEQIVQGILVHTPRAGLLWDDIMSSYIGWQRASERSFDRGDDEEMFNHAALCRDIYCDALEIAADEVLAYSGISTRFTPAEATAWGKTMHLIANDTFKTAVTP